MEHGNANLDDNSFLQFSIEKSNPGIRFETHFPTCTKLWSVAISTALCPSISPPQGAPPPMGTCARMFNFSISTLLVQFMMQQYSSGLYSEPPPLMRHLPVLYGLLLAVPLPVSGAMQIPTQPENPFSHLFKFLFKQSILPILPQLLKTRDQWVCKSCFWTDYSRREGERYLRASTFQKHTLQETCGNQTTNPLSMKLSSLASQIIEYFIPTKFKKSQLLNSMYCSWASKHFCTRYAFQQRHTNFHFALLM